MKNDLKSGAETIKILMYQSHICYQNMGIVWRNQRKSVLKKLQGLDAGTPLTGTLYYLNSII